MKAISFIIISSLFFVILISGCTNQPNGIDYNQNAFKDTVFPSEQELNSVGLFFGPREYRLNTDLIQDNDTFDKDIVTYYLVTNKDQTEDYWFGISSEKSLTESDSINRFLSRKQSHYSDEKVNIIRENIIGENSILSGYDDDQYVLIFQKGRYVINLDGSNQFNTDYYIAVARIIERKI